MADQDIEPVEDFARRAKAWIEANLERDRGKPRQTFRKASRKRLKTGSDTGRFWNRAGDIVLHIPAGQRRS